MPKSMAGTNQCKRKPTPSPIAIHTPILNNTMSRNRNRDRTSLPFLLEPPSHSTPRMTTADAPFGRPRANVARLPASRPAATTTASHQVASQLRAGIPSTLMPPAAHNDDAGLPLQAGPSPYPLLEARQLGGGDNPSRGKDGYEIGDNRRYTP
jgi:hypothetical protein